MARFVSIVFTAIAAVAQASAGEPAADASAPADAALAADAAFAARAAERGQRAAFEEVLAPDGILFRPGPVRGHEWMDTHEGGDGRLAWSPAAAIADCAGRLVVTTGPWTYATAEGSVVATGDYLSIWQPGADGGWELVLDNGVDHPARDDAATVLAAAYAALPSPATPRECARRDRAPALGEVDDRLNAAIHDEGLGRALSDVAARSAVAYRDDAAIATLPVETDAAFAAGTAARRDYASDGSSDLGYTYGTIEAAGGGPKAAYVRVWRREGRHWSLVIDLRSPMDGA
ncbi:MAG: hypothetical protein U1F08_13130 [Steroidobacteraceae bacterium]